MKSLPEEQKKFALRIRSDAIENLKLLSASYQKDMMDDMLAVLKDFEVLFWGLIWKFTTFMICSRSP